MNVWKSDEKLVTFAWLISPSKIILFEKLFSTLFSVFHLVMKHCVSCLIYYLVIYHPLQQTTGKSLKS